MVLQEINHKASFRPQVSLLDSLCDSAFELFRSQRICMLLQNSVTGGKGNTRVHCALPRWASFASRGPTRVTVLCSTGTAEEKGDFHIKSFEIIYHWTSLLDEFVGTDLASWSHYFRHTIWVEMQPGWSPLISFTWTEGDANSRCLSMGSEAQIRWGGSDYAEERRSHWNIVF